MREFLVVTFQAAGDDVCKLILLANLSIQQTSKYRNPFKLYKRLSVDAYQNMLLWDRIVLARVIYQKLV